MIVNCVAYRWSCGYPAAVASMVLIDRYLVYGFKKAKWM